ncbi:related to CDC7 - protein kinase [Melanopsichium pennsylvanicum]|uniref:non-specific serine/threonine protein kinase n=2 Tax=Melanopsichium pennsylvanicum TaxID=63383 RepID=A0AAJ4XIK8_9BASI|nr:related to CDC7-protein kinase [Melanopsichium pennsylvanicum 4]SNX82707.1 related to CDC7 - protein kinase [Melanopsichium pennsylvanicum]
MTEVHQQQGGLSPETPRHRVSSRNIDLGSTEISSLAKSEPVAAPSTTIPSPQRTPQTSAQIAQHQLPQPIQPQVHPTPGAAQNRDESQSTLIGMVHSLARSRQDAVAANRQSACNEPSPAHPGQLGSQPHRLKAGPCPEHVATVDEQVDDTDDGDEATEETTDTHINTSSEDAKHAELIKLQEEIEDLENAIQGLGDHYHIIDRLGEGTFSSVYKAIDLQHHAFDNDEWVSRGLLNPFRKGVCHVALKKIYVTSSPQRIFNELSIMEDLRPAEYVSYLITAFRSEDQIVAVMPYSRHADFRDYYKQMPLGDFKFYFRCLFSALQSVHEAGIMHRDIKPANFLYDPSTGHGTLCDFGLAERFEATEWRGKCHHTCPTPQHPHGTKEINRAVDSIWFEPGKALSGLPLPTESSTSGASTADPNAEALGGASSSKPGVMEPPPERIGYLVHDARQGVRANRAGTRGFRAPEVLFKCQDQTVAIDIWSAGVILLTLLIRRFPVFNSNDDVEALLEIAVIFGKSRLEMCAMLHNRTFHCNIPTVSNSASLTHFIGKLNPDLKNPGHHPNPKQYHEDVVNALDMVKSCLHVDCTRRKTAAELLEHPFLRIDDELAEDEMMEDEHMQQNFADYYQVGDEYAVDANEARQEVKGDVYEEEDELETVDEDEYARSEEVVQLRSRRGVEGKPSETGEPIRSLGQQQQQHHNHTQHHQHTPIGAEMAHTVSAANPAHLM